MSSTTERRPGALLRATCLTLAGLFGAAAGLAVAWYVVLGDLSNAERAAGAEPAELLRRVAAGLWPETLVPSLCAGALAGVLTAMATARRRRSRQAWRARKWILSGGANGASLAAFAGFLLVAAWSVGTLNFGGAPPSIQSQSRDIAARPCRLLGAPRHRGSPGVRAVRALPGPGGVRPAFRVGALRSSQR